MAKKKLLIDKWKQSIVSPTSTVEPWDPTKAGNLYKYKIHSDIFKTVFTKDANQDFLKNP